MALWIVLAVGVLSYDHPFGVPRALLASLLLTLFLSFVTVKLFVFFDREQRFISAGVTLSSCVVLALLTVKFYWFDFDLKVFQLIGIFILPLVVSVLTNGWRKHE